MWSTNTNFDMLDFHDAPIISVSMEEFEITLELEFCNILAGYPANSFEVAQCCKGSKLRFLSVVASKAMVFEGTRRLFVPHPEPNWPIDAEILEAVESESEESALNQQFKLSGMHKAGWSEWTIECASFELLWQEFSGDAWFVKRPP